MGMKHRERVKVSIQHQRPDRIPLGELVIPDQLVEKALPSVAADQCHLEMKRAFLEQLDMDLVVVEVNQRQEGQALASGALAEVEYWVQNSELFVFVLFTGGFTISLQQLGWRRFFEVLARSPAEILPLIHITHAEIVRQASLFLQAGADGIIIGDDIAYSRGLLAGPELTRSVLFPSLAETVASLKIIRDCPVFFHSEGNLTSIVDDIVAAGFDGLHSLEPDSGMDLRRLKEAYGQELCLMGNLELKYLLSSDRAELEKRISDILETMRTGAGFIFSTTGGLVAEVDIEQLKTMCNLVTTWMDKNM